jgi:pSer/pThr/pTyr-binding forkhead associated (FHA) protein
MIELHLMPLWVDDPVGEGDSHRIPITCFPCVLGRGPASDHRIDDKSVSRRHCVLALRGDRVWVEDLGSRNGTSLNGERLTGPRPLAHGDVLELAHFNYLVHLQDAPSKTYPAQPTRAKEQLGIPSVTWPLRVQGK